MTTSTTSIGWTDADRREQDHLDSLAQDDMARLSKLHSEARQRAEDRELLELAAKAIGITLQWNSEADLRPRRIDDDSWTPWHSLDDDGDAMRVAIQLNMLVDPGKGGCHVRYLDRTPKNSVTEMGETGRAARRAITRAAAEIGKSMPQTV